MKAATAKRIENQIQMSDAKLTSTKVSPAPKWNAVKHGLRAGGSLLPGDDIAAFRELRRDYFHCYKPRTRVEARCVERIVSCEWRMLRCERWQGVFDKPVEDSFPGPSKAVELSQPDPHRLEHRGMDCTLQERRLLGIMAKEEARLETLQRQRAHNLIAEADVVKDFQVFLAEGEPLERQEPAAARNADYSATRSDDKGSCEDFNREAAAPAKGFPKHWSRRQREAAMRPEAGNLEPKTIVSRARKRR